MLEEVSAGNAIFIFIYRHPLDSLLTNWVWWRTYLRDKIMVQGISQVYKNADDFCADLEANFLEFMSFAEGDPALFSRSIPPAEFSRIAKVMSLDVDATRMSVAPPRNKPFGFVAVKEKVFRFRRFVDNLDAETKKYMEEIGYDPGL
jgi:hypothetical protein